VDRVDIEQAQRRVPEGPYRSGAITSHMTSQIVLAVAR
jgi:hypothetical protein